MKMADILHSIADMLDRTDGESDSSNKAELTPVNHEVHDDTESVTMVPPLQQKLELLKKASGVDSHFDDEGSDELDDIKKLTGVKAVIQHVAGEDNDITG